MFDQTNLKLVLLDRDGVINVDRPDSVKSVQEFIFLPNVAEAIKKLNDAKIPVVIITNQAVVGRGTMSEDTLDEIHDHMLKTLQSLGAKIDRIYQCTSADPNHPDRKPNPGMVVKTLNDFQVNPQDVVFIGDALRDLEAAASAQCRRYLILTGKGEKTLEEGLPDYVQPVTICKNLLEAVNNLLETYDETRTS